MFRTVLQALSVLVLFAALAAGFSSALQAQDTGAPIATLRTTAPLAEPADAPRMPPVVNDDIRRPRSYPEQPPTIPHRIDGYQVDRFGNKCLACHARSRVAESGAPMVSITHFMDRDGQFRAAVSPRRYFCNQCHVVQTRVPEAVENRFVDIDSLLAVQAGRK